MSQIKILFCLFFWIILVDTWDFMTQTYLCQDIGSSDLKRFSLSEIRQNPSNFRY